MKLLLLAASALTLLPTQDAPGEAAATPHGTATPAVYVSAPVRAQTPAAVEEPWVPGILGASSSTEAPSFLATSVPVQAPTSLASVDKQLADQQLADKQLADEQLSNGGEPAVVGAARLADQVQELENRLGDDEQVNAQTQQALREREEQDAEDAAQGEEVRQAREMRVGMVSDAVDNLSRAVSSMQSTSPDAAAMTSAETSLREAAANADQYGSTQEADALRSAWTDLSAAQKVMEQENGPAAQANLQAAVRDAQRALRAARMSAP